jgi:signal transduction histidine kinase/CheY-like chemotaxis protein
MSFIIKWRYGRLEREKQRLEGIVKERTKEIQEKTLQLENQTEQLKEQSAKLTEMDKVKSRFFANISHEFRTPLTLIMGPLEQMLTTGGESEEERKRKLGLMLRNSQRLLNLINQLLELSKFESGEMKLQASRQNIIPFLKGITATFESVTAKNELDLTFHAKAGEENITLYFDPEKLEDIIFNLLSNAVKFTPPGGKITVEVARNPADDAAFPSGSVTISVCDTGPGIPRDQLEYIFDRFYQSDSTYEHHRKGSGIGLTIARELVGLHRGRIDVHSHEGKGTEFIIRLPMGKEHLEPDEMVEVPEAQPAQTDDNNARMMDISGMETPGTPAVETGEYIDADTLGKNIILVVEDSSEARSYIRESLEPEYKIMEAADGEEGIRKAKGIIPDLIISDIMMPGADGYELCRVLKNDINTSHIPVILLTAKASEADIIQGLETGADDYITKPFNTRILCARIKNLIDLRSHMQQKIQREMTFKPVKMSVSQMDKKFLKKLKDVIDENLSDPDFNIEQLCKKMEMSQPTLYRKIHALSGESPTEFIRSCRLKRGAELLKNKSLTVLEAAFEVGFSSANYFTKCFKKKFHQLPTTFKETESGE